MQEKIPNSIWQSSQNGSQNFLMIVLHGRGDSPEGFTWLQSELQIPELNFLLLQAPDDYYGGYSWYGMPPNQLPGILRSRELLKNIFIEIEKSGFKPEQCILFGFSQGCLMTLEFGSRYPHLLMAYIGISGYCYHPQALLQEAQARVIHQGKWLITHGTQDDVLPVESTRAQIQELIERGFKIDYREYKKVHTIDLQIELNDIREWLKNILGLCNESKALT